MLIGHHVYTSKGFTTAASYGRSNNADIIQIFLSSPQSFHISNIKILDLIKLRNSAKNNNVILVVHGSFLLNMCRDPNNDGLKKAKKVLISDMNNSVILVAIGVIIHMGKITKDMNTSDDEALKNYITNVKDILKRTDKRSILILETGAGQGHEIGTKLNIMAKIRDGLNYNEIKRVKFCLDTCHMFSAGYNLGDKNMIEILDQYIEMTLGWENIVVIHLNDSKNKLNARVDRHQDIGKGYINISGLKEFVRKCVKHNIPLILETPGEEHDGIILKHKEQIELVRKFIK
jgi:deoxyribonuclease-4